MGCEGCTCRDSGAGARRVARASRRRKSRHQTISDKKTLLAKPLSFARKESCALAASVLQATRLVLAPPERAVPQHHAAPRRGIRRVRPSGRLPHRLRGAPAPADPVPERARVPGTSVASFEPPDRLVVKRPSLRRAPHLLLLFEPGRRAHGQARRARPPRHRVPHPRRGRRRGREAQRGQRRGGREEPGANTSASFKSRRRREHAVTHAVSFSSSSSSLSRRRATPRETRRR